MQLKAGKNFCYRMLCGFFLGISIIAPGVSGSIMAVMMGIYDRLIQIISNPFKNLKQNVIYLLPMGIGALLSVALFIQLFEWLFEVYPVPAYLLFIALIAGGLGTVYQQASKDGIKTRHVFAGVVALAVATAIGLLAKQQGSGATSVSSIGILSLSLGGLFAGVSSMIPGVSVSMVLMLFGAYQPLLNAASDIVSLVIGVGTAALDTAILVRSASILVPAGVLFLLGMVFFSKFIQYVFSKHRSLGFFVVLGFMLGTMIGIFPGLPQGLFQWLLSGAMVLLGVGLSVLFEHLGKTFQTEE